MDNSAIEDLLETAVQKRSVLGAVTDAMRLVNGFGDRMDGLVLDRYGSHFVIQILDPRWHEYCQFILEFLKKRLNARYLVVKDRTGAAAGDPSMFISRVWLDAGTSCTTVHEHGLEFVVDCNDTLNTGLFLDMRSNREVVSGFAPGRKVLNCFAYTCSFGVYCRSRAAASVVNVDVSRKCLDRGLENYRLNRLIPSRNEFIRADAVEYLERACKKHNLFDMIILDPPSFSRFDGASFSVRKDFASLIRSAVRVLNPNGILFAATNYSAMMPDSIKDMILESAGKRRLKHIAIYGQDQDFPGSGLMQESSLAAVLAEIA